MKRVWVWLLWAALGQAAWAQGAPVSEPALKAALFFKLPLFVYRGGEDRAHPLVVCLLGNGSYVSAFERLAQTPIDGRPVRFNRLNAAAEAAQCDFVFVAQSESAQLSSLLRQLAQLRPVTVSEISGFARAGGMVELEMGVPGTPVNILINRQAAQQKNIEFNAQLLRLAKVVEP